MNLISILENSVKQYATKTALVLGEHRVSYAELDESSNRVANALTGMGLRKGDRVAMIMTNNPEFASVYLGIIKAGGTAVPLDTRYRAEEFSSVFANCKPKMLVAESPFLEPLIPDLPRFGSIERVIDMSSSSEGKFLSYQEIMATSSAQKAGVELLPDDTINISYTSGPTIHPKGSTFSHRILCAEIIISGEGFKQTAEDVVMIFALPVYHNFALIAGLLGSINKGSTIVMVPGTGISIGSLMEAIEKEKGTILFAVPYIYALAIKMAKREGIKNDLSSLRLCGSAGAPLTVNTIRQFKRYYGFTIIDFYGLTEATCHVTCQPIDGTGKLGSTGKALPGWEIKIVDDDGNELPQNQSGEIIVKGPIMKGYYNNPKITAETIKNGWLYTGDIGMVDENGYLFITGRKKRMIILKGQNVYPSDIEEVLLTHPKIAEVKVVGVPDRLRGEIVRAFIVLKQGEAATEHEIRHFCQERMADYKSPREIIFAVALPETAAAGAGKKNLKAYLSNLSALTRPPVEERQDYHC